MQSILDGLQQIAIPTFVSTLAICIVFVPVVFLRGAAKYLFTPLALAVVFAIFMPYLLSRTLVPTMTHFLLRREAALIAQQRAAAAYEAAKQARILQEEALQAEQEKYSVGATTSFFLIQYQRDLAQARSDEVLAESLYGKAQTALDRAVGKTLVQHNIEFEEAYRGELQRPPQALPPR